MCGRTDGDSGDSLAWDPRFARIPGSKGRWIERKEMRRIFSSPCVAPESLEVQCQGQSTKNPHAKLPRFPRKTLLTGNEKWLSFGESWGRLGIFGAIEAETS
ncbi:MAG TPA: hypothetical protein DD670_13355 [Planctomycetaceae bacterium]|nr:hypothetical protein [Planctomycetaceae bacterium]